MAGHPPSVVNNSRDVARKRDKISILVLILQCLPEINYMHRSVVSNQLYASLCSNSDSLSVSFQLTDLKEDHEVVFGVTRSCRGASHGAELGGRD